MIGHSKEEVRTAVRSRYGEIAKTESSCCGTECCTPAGEELGYSEEEKSSVPKGSNLGLGCGNPLAIASLRSGETVLDLGSGAGFDCFLAARAVGPEGRVIGVDMTPEMISKARTHAQGAGIANVEFRLGEIEHLPVADQSIDVVLSNCVINLSPEKRDVFREAHRVLRPGGRLAISDIVAKSALPANVASDLSQVAGCVGGAISPKELESMLEETGFTGIRVRIVSPFGDEPAVSSASIEAVKIR